ncbi:MAG: hypothetical protein II937_09965 [Bacteroidales bacterium]|nr:hypothetical protein [Bacteroidales bacterium]
MVRIKTNEEIIASVRLYRILHKPTGLYYKPGYVNLSKKGKVYTKKPSLKHCLQHWTGGAYWLGIGEDLKPIMAAKAIPIKWEPCRLYIQVEESDLEIIEVKTK